jgi:hypothetical protein
MPPERGDALLEAVYALAESGDLDRIDLRCHHQRPFAAP